MSSENTYVPSFHYAHFFSYLHSNLDLNVYTKNIGKNNIIITDTSDSFIISPRHNSPLCFKVVRVTPVVITTIHYEQTPTQISGPVKRVSENEPKSEPDSQQRLWDRTENEVFRKGHSYYDFTSVIIQSMGSV